MPMKPYRNQYGYYPDGGIVTGWKLEDFCFHWWERLVAKIELRMAHRPGRWAIAVGVGGFLLAGLVSAFLPLAPVYAPLSDVVSTSVLFATGLWEYWIVRTRRLSAEEIGFTPWALASRTRRPIRVDSEDDIPAPLVRGIVYLVGPPNEER